MGETAQLCRRVARRRMLAAASDIIVMAFAGLVYSWSLFVAPLEADFGWLRAQTSLTFTICIISNASLAFFSAMLARKIGSQWVTRICAIVTCLGFLGASQVQSLWQIYICYGVLCGGAIGGVYNQTLATIVTWFRDRGSMMTGLLLMCYGMGSMILSPLISALLGKVGWRGTFTVLAFMSLVILMLGSFQTRIPTAEERAVLPEPPLVTRSNAAFSSGRDYLPAGMIRTWGFWLYVLWNMSVGLIGLTMSGHASPIAQSVGVTAGLSAVYVGCYSFLNGLGRVGFGTLFDRIGRRACTVTVSCVGIMAGLTLILACRTTNQVLMFAAFLLLGVTFGGGPVCSASIVKELFGEKNYGVNLAFGNLSILISAFAGPYMAGLIYQSSGYPAVALFLTLSATFSLVVALMLAARKKI